MKKVALVDYIGNSDNQGNPIGHPIKVIEDYHNLLKENLKITLIVPKIYEKKIIIKTKRDLIPLKYYMNMFDYSLIGKMKNIIARLLNIKYILKQSKDFDVIWFMNIDWVLYLYLSIFMVRNNKKIWVTQYKLIYKNNKDLFNKILKILNDKAIGKIDYILSSNSRVMEKYKNILEIPDYFNDKNLFLKYKHLEKINKVIAVGTIMESKDLENVVRVFKNIDFNLEIVGEFHEVRRLNTLKNLAEGSKNISILNKKLNNEEYYSLIAESKYVILPYKKEYYFERTSGVLIESRFLDSIPIAPKYLLEFNKINGIAYENIEDLISIFNENLLENNDVISNFNEDLNIYNLNIIRDKIIRAIND